MIRLARADELEHLREIERCAGTAFVAIGMPEIAADDPPPAAALEAYRADGRAWVVDEDGTAVAYVIVDVLDGFAHVEQVSVHPDAAGRGLGRRLLDHVAAWGEAEGHRGVTLTTFRHVPWNAPYYERCGFRALRDDELGPELRERMVEEAAHGLDPEQRVAMVNWPA